MMTPAGHEHGRIAMRLGSLLDQHVRQHKLGVVYAAETGFLIARDPDTVRASDVTFVSQARLDVIGDVKSYLPLAPDLVGEVISPNDAFSDVEALAAGSSLVLLVDPDTCRLQACRASENIIVLGNKKTLVAEDVVPEWRLPITDLFD
jgi:Uma2 family endonuclease